MKKNNYLLLPLIVLLIFINSCVGYKPIFSSSNIKFKISDYKIEGNQKIGKIIYSKLNLLISNCTGMGYLPVKQASQY